jgi:threonylcarbamoyladenosine tRNA methylthiotransferase MtaB
VKYAIVTFGCRVNQADSCGFETGLRAEGARPTTPDDADVVVVNTCTVTASADQAARQAIRRVARLNPRARIVVTGCYATSRPEQVAALANVEHVVSNEDKPRLLHFLRRPEVLRSSAPTPESPGWLGQSTAERFGRGEGACGESIVPGTAGRTVFTLRVQTGCSEPCTYCIIPSTRGRPQSLRLPDVIREVDRARSGAAGVARRAPAGPGRSQGPRRQVSSQFPGTDGLF